MATVTWTLSAQADLRDIVQFIAQDSAVYAAATGERLWASVERLRAFPASGRIIPEFGDPARRELIVVNYRIMYRLQQQRVVVTAVVHARRDLQRYRREGG